MSPPSRTRAVRVSAEAGGGSKRVTRRQRIEPQVMLGKCFRVMATNCVRYIWRALRVRVDLTFMIEWQNRCHRRKSPCCSS